MARELTISVYTNKKGEPRLSLMMSYAFAMRVATDDLDALDKIRHDIKRRIELVESRAEGGAA